MPKIIYFVAGEASADNYGAALMEALRRHDVDLRFFGRGGPRMAALAGGDFKNWIAEAGVVGWWEVVKHWGYFREKFEETLKEIAENKPAAVVLIDYPGFNLRLAEQLRKKFTPQKIIYYISPQVWAWHRGRIPKMTRLLDLMICIFPFEKPLYEKSGLKTIFVGYPHLDELIAHKLDIPRDETLVGIFPGSRGREIRKIFPIMLKAAQLMQQSRPELHFEAGAASEALAREMNDHIRAAAVDCKIVTGRTHELMQRAAAGMVASGTATVEAAFFKMPFVIVYRFVWISTQLVKTFVKIPWAGMVNILANKGIVREFLHEKAEPEPIATEMLRLLNEPAARKELLSELENVIAQLGPPGASQRAAAAILEEIGAIRLEC